MPFEAPELFVEASSRYRLPASVASLSDDGTEARLDVAVEARGERDLGGLHPIIPAKVGRDERVAGVRNGPSQRGLPGASHRQNRRENGRPPHALNLILPGLGRERQGDRDVHVRRG